MPDITQDDDPDALVSGPNMRSRIGKCSMTMDRWERAGKFPPPDLRINGRKYWRERTYAKWLRDQLAAETARRDRDISTAKDASPEIVDQLGHNGGPPLDDAVKQSDSPAIKVGGKMRSGKNG